MKMLKLAFLISIIFILGCSDSGDSPTAPSDGGGGTVTDPSFATDIAPLIIGNSCLNSGCHGSGSTSGGLSFGSASYNEVISASGTNGSVVVTGNASASSFYVRVAATNGGMPLGLPALSTTDINKIRDWINQGAKDN